MFPQKNKAYITWHGSRSVSFVIVFAKPFCVLQAFTCAFPMISEFAAIL